MSLLILATIAVASAGAAPVCQNTGPTTAAAALYSGDRSASARRLDELPPAKLILTIVRREGDCERPVIVRADIGNTPTR